MIKKKNKSKMDINRLRPIAQMGYKFKMQKIKNFDFEVFDINLH